MSYAHLADVFFKNWVKAPGVFHGAMPEEMKAQLEKLGCTFVGGFQGGAQADFLCSINVEGEIKLSDLTLAKEILKPTGVYFIRITERPNLLDNFLELLSQQPTFKVAETYVIGNSRDLLLKQIDRKPRVCIGMIAKNEERDLPRCLESLDGVADGLVLLDTGSKDNTKAIARSWADNQKKTNPGFTHKVREYLEASEQDATGDWKLWNFGKARNEYVRLIEEDGFDYVLWMDADDKLLDRKIKNLIYLDQYVIHGVQIESGGLRWPHHRLWKTKKGVRYSGWCHEYPNWGWQPAIVHQDIAIFHDAAPGLGENSNDRNLRILKREMESEPNPRTAFYLANTLKDRGVWAEAIPFYQRRMDFGVGYEDEYYFALLYKGRCERLAKKFDDARKTLMKGISEKPTWAEFWMELAYLETALGNHWKTIAWALHAKDLPVAHTQLFREKDKYTDQPYRVISWAYWHLWKLEDSLAWAKLAKEKIGGPDADWDSRIADLEMRCGKKPNARRVVWNRPGALGDVLMTLNLVRLYKEKNPNDQVIYRAHPSILSHMKNTMIAAGVDMIWNEPTTYHKEYVLIGYPIKEGYPEKPMKKHLLQYFSEELGLGGEVASLKLPLPKRLIEGDYMTVHVKAGWSMYKEWKFENWVWLCDQLKSLGIRVVQIGGPDDPKIPSAYCMLGKTWEESLGILAHAKMHLGIDSWTNHATNIEWEGKGKTTGVILWGSTQSSAAGYSHNKNISANLPCQPCFREDPKISQQSRGICPHPKDQTYENPQHLCMQSLRREDVLSAALDHWDLVTEFQSEQTLEPHLNVGSPTHTQLYQELR